MRRLLTNLAKLSISIALLAYLFSDVQRSDPETFARLREHPPSWETLLFGWACLMGALLAGVMRWQALLIAVGGRSDLGSLLRWAVYGCALDFAALGTAGGDAVKALLVSRRSAVSGVTAALSVILDRLLGLYLMLTVAAIVVLFGSVQADLSTLRLFLLSAATAGNLGLAVFWLVPGVGEVVERWVRAWGQPGDLLAQAIVALRHIHRRPQAMVTAVASGLGVVCLHVAGNFLVAASLPGEAPTFAEQWLIVPIAMLSAILPLPGGTLGALDLAMSFLYQHVTGGRVTAAQGLLATMLGRTITLFVTTLAIGLYFSERPAVVQREP